MEFTIKPELHTYLVYTEEERLTRHCLVPPQPSAVIKSYTETGARAALYLAVKSGELNLDPENCYYQDITQFKEIITHESNEFCHTKISAGPVSLN